MTRHSIAFAATVCVGLATLAMDQVALDGLDAVDGAGSAIEAEVISVVPSGAAAAPAPAQPEPRASGEDLRPEGGLHVLVTHAGQPLGGAEVRAYLRHRAEVLRGEPQWMLAGIAATGADGVASVAAPAGTYLVTARSSLLAPAHAAVVRPAGEARTTVTVALVEPVAVAGRVLARGDGEPVPLASLALCRTGMDLLGAVPMPAEECARAIADTWGRFSISVAPGRYALEAAAVGFHGAHLAVTAPAALDVRLAAGAVVEGFVLQPDGAPAGGAEVVLTGGDEAVSATAGSSGGFAAEVEAGTYTVTARRGRVAGAWPSPVTVAAGGRARDLVIRLGAAAAIGGLVTAADGTPLPGAAVAVSSPGATGELAHAESDAAGRFAVEALAAGTYQVTVAADGWSPASRTGIALLGGERVEIAIA
ncbi:MAG TPA: carboxypeptidase-like regulatory domain-containing protein, partial [Anaeromyxobacteraceae bacterium]|nr:carboxypeptidase-like regulatory domain-containing protein [Anaeromyxobacteraceae bacterium]